jgi:hypothetical protein
MNLLRTTVDTSKNSEEIKDNYSITNALKRRLLRIGKAIIHIQIYKILINIIILSGFFGGIPAVIAKPLVVEVTGVGSEVNTKLNAIDQQTRTLRWQDENSQSSFGPSISASFDLFNEYRLGLKYSPSSGRQVGQVGRYECFLLCAWVSSDVINGTSGGSVLNYKLNNFLVWSDREFSYGAYNITPRVGVGIAAGKFDFQLNGTNEATSGAIPAPAVGLRIERPLPHGLVFGVDTEFYRSRIAQTEIRWADTRLFAEKDVSQGIAVKLGYLMKNFSFDYSDSKIQSNLNFKRDAIFLSLLIRLH